MCIGEKFWYPYVSYNWYTDAFLNMRTFLLAELYTAEGGQRSLKHPPPNQHFPRAALERTISTYSNAKPLGRSVWYDN